MNTLWLVAVLLAFFSIGLLHAADNPFAAPRKKIQKIKAAIKQEDDPKRKQKLTLKLNAEEARLKKTVARKVAPLMKKIAKLKKKKQKLNSQINDTEKAVEIINALAWSENPTAALTKTTRREISPGQTEVEFISSRDQTPQIYIEVLPADFKPRKPVDIMITLHGHGADCWQYIREGRGECKGARDAAAKHGMIQISPDYRAKTSWMGPAAEADLVQIIAIQKSAYKVRKIYLVGGSMGGTSVLIFTGLHPDLVAGVVSNNGTANMLTYTNFQNAIAASYGGDKKAAATEYKKRSPELTPKVFTMPIAFTVGGKDTTVPPDSVRRLFEALKKFGKKDIFMLDRPNTGHSTNYADTMSALEFVLQQ